MQHDYRRQQANEECNEERNIVIAVDLCVTLLLPYTVRNTVITAHQRVKMVLRACPSLPHAARSYNARSVPIESATLFAYIFRYNMRGMPMENATLTP